jgi:acetylornithine deacetylase/succinyl-diaminopimelate desuccinylase-like protein
VAVFQAEGLVVENAQVNATLERVRTRVAERFPADLERIRDYLRLPSVSATGEGIRATAEATGAWIEGAGGSFELVQTPGHPLVLGELPGPAGAPRLLRYGMYDVQPAEEPAWTSPPFAAEVRELPGVGPAVVARGSANSKGCLAAFFLAVEVLRELDAMPPLTVVLLIEGEEELGSPNLPAVVRDRAADLRAEGAFDLDLTAGLDGQPELILGCKGLCSLELVAEGGDWGGPAIDLHSSEQAWIASPVWALVHALATLTDEDERIRVAGLDGAATPGDGDARLLAELAETFDPAEHLREARAARYRLPGGAPELLEALLFRPTLNVSGIAGGYVGPGGKTIVPSRAVALVDIRLVPGGDDPEAAAAAVRRHLDRHGFGHVQVRMLESYPWAKAPPGNRSELALRASYRALGRRPLPYPLAPWCAPYYVFDRILGLPWAAGGVGHAAGAHGPDEYATVAGLQEHVVGAAAFLLAYAAGAVEAPA